MTNLQWVDRKGKIQTTASAVVIHLIYETPDALHTPKRRCGSCGEQNFALLDPKFCGEFYQLCMCLGCNRIYPVQ